MSNVNYDELKEVLEFKKIPGSNGYVINCFGQVFHHKTKSFKMPDGKKWGVHYYVVLIVNGQPKELLIFELLFQLFGVTHHREDERFDDLLLALNRERKV